MRQALNDNPVVQAAVLGVMAIAVGFLLFTRVLGGGGSSEEAAAPATGTATEPGAAAPAAPSTDAPADSATTAPPATGTVPPVTEAVPGAPAPSAGVEGEFVPGPGLPKPVVSAYDGGKTVVLMLEKRKGLDDQALQKNLGPLRERGGLALFQVPAKDVSRYARITEGIQLDRVPALVVVSPKRLSDGTPEATVSYGFRGPESVRQAVEDALFDGKPITYDP